MGDFNVHFENVENNNSRRLHGIIDIFNLTQSVTEPTHNQGHPLDLVLFKQSDNILLSTKLHHGLHLTTAILFKPDLSVPQKKPKTLYRCLKKIDTDTCKQDLSDVISPNSSIADYNNQFRSVLDKHAPLCRRTSRTRKPTPWFSSIAEQFYELKRERRKTERRWIKSKLTVHKQIYDSIKQKVTNLVDKAKKPYFSAKIQSSTTCKQVFQKNQKNKRKKRNSTPCSVKPFLRLFLQLLTLLISRLSFLNTSRRRSTPSETIFLFQTKLLALIPLSLEILYRPLILSLMTLS